MSDVKHASGCPQCVHPMFRQVAKDCTCGAERIAELDARVRDLEAQLTHLRNLIASHEGKATSLVEEIRRGLEES